ncbi:MAG: hypothetical protein RLZZ387_895 [Chloroflexota bacterium]|jgi:CRISPR-associated endonuclease/helicase Cas3
MINKAEFKSEGLDALRIHLLAQATPVRQADLARHFGVNRSTIGRWLISLEANDVPILWDEQKRVAIDRKQYVTHLRLTRHESIVLMLALRLYQQQQDKPDRNGVVMLEKLGIALRQGVAPEAGEYVLSLAHQQRRALLDQRSDYQRILEAVSDAWVDSRKVQIRYRPLNARRAFDDVFHPYLLEPSAVGHSTYAIGYSELAKAVRIRKLERVERTPLVLDERFSVIPGFDVFRLLGSAWRIWFDEGAQPITVRLRFAGNEAVRRIVETTWHPSQRTELDAEGRLLWTAEIDEPQEMLPWIRGWGGACEILQPLELREQVLGELRRQMRLYGITETTSDNRQQRFDDIFG